MIAVVQRNRTREESRAEPSHFIFDTGSDVAMVPVAVARKSAFVGYDRAAAAVRFGTSFGGELTGQWGELSVYLETDRVLAVPCFYYRRPPAARWFDGWAMRWLLGTPEDGPLVLGCDGLLGGSFSLLIDGNVAVGVFDRQLLPLIP